VMPGVFVRHLAGMLVWHLAGMLVRRLAAVISMRPMVVMLGGAAERKIRADPRQRSERGDDERCKRERSDDSTPARAPRPPASG